MSEACAHCGKHSAALSRCTRCWNTRYCSRDCQKSHWPRHKVTCVKRPATSPDDKKNKDRPSSDKKDTSPPSGQNVSSKTKKDGQRTSAESSHKGDPAHFTCKVCKTKSTKVKRCGRCRNVTYCSQDCQRADWLTHKITCSPADRAAKSQDKMERTENSDNQGDKRSKPKDDSSEVSSDNKTGEATAAPSPQPEESDGELKTCQICKAKKKIMKRCGRCHDVTYCSRDCQSADWTSHKVTCTPIEVLTTDGYRETERREKAAKREVEARARQSSSSSGIISWQEARFRAARLFSLLEVVDDFDHLDSDFMGVSFPFLSSMGMGSGVVAVGRLTTSYFHPFRHAWRVEDINGRSLYVIFYNKEFPWPFFQYSQLREGNFICIRDAVVHQFFDGSVGFRIDDASDVRILEPNPLFRAF